MSTPLLLLVSWIPPLWMNSAFILFGLYHGFIATLPIGPSRLLSIRAFLLGGNISGTIAISGSIIGQSIIFLSVYYSPLYVVLMKPHALTLLALPYTFFYWYRIKDLFNYQSLRPITSFRDTRIYELFFDSITFQLLNPILLPSPVLARLLNIFIFRYSSNILFLTSTILGWFCGQYLFINLGILLLFRIESDSPILYLLVKRVIHRTFSIIILSLSLLHLGRAPVPFIMKKMIDNLQLDSREESLRLQKSWYSLFFDHRQWRRPFRYIGNSRFSTRGPMKRRVSQYFFDVCLSDGKQRLAFMYSPSLAMLGKNFEQYFNHSESWTPNKSFTEWINTGRVRGEFIYNGFQHRIESLDDGLKLEEVTEKRAGLSNSEGRILVKNYDPLLGGQVHGVIIVSKSPWISTERSNRLGEGQDLKPLPEGGNKLKDWISNQWSRLEYGNFVLPWEPLNQDARRILGLLINKSKGVDPKRVHFLDGDATIDSNDKSVFSIGDTRRKVNRKSNLNWELILNFSPRQKILYLNHLEMSEWNTLKNSWKELLLSNRIIDIPSLLAETLGIIKKFRFREIDREIPRWTSDLRNDKFDVIAMGVTDIRQRRVKNLGYLVKGRDKRRKIVRRFSQQSDFRRKLVKGAMRARRRKTLIWRMFQLETKSPFFLRMSERSIPTKAFANDKNIFGLRLASRPGIRNKNFFSEKKALSFKRTRADRLSIANRWDFPLAQWGRSWLLIIQSHFRKYVALPVLIVSKNVSRLLLLQNPEWNEDWSEWNEEIHIKCTYDGTEVSEKELPEQWLRDGLQIKIVYPFCLKPWHSYKHRKINLGEDVGYLGEGRKKLNYCYLTAWGFSTDLPFGNMRKQPSFWKPISRELRRGWKKKKPLKFLPVIVESPIMADALAPFGARIRESSEPDSYNSDSDGKCQKNFFENNNYGIRESPMVSDEDFILREEPKYGTSIHIQNLEDSIAKENRKRTGLGRDRDSHPNRRERRIRSAKRLNQIERIITQSYEKNIQLVKKWFSFSGIKIQRIGVNFQVKMEIIKEFVGHFSSYSNSSNNSSNDNNN